MFCTTLCRASPLCTIPRMLGGALGGCWVLSWVLSRPRGVGMTGKPPPQPQAAGREAQPQPQEGAARGTSAGTGSGHQQPPPSKRSPALLPNTCPGGCEREEMGLMPVG